MYNKQTWLDEIPDMTKPIYDSSGKQKTDPQTGRPLFELVQVGTRITSNRLNTMEGGIEAAHTLVEQLAKELGGNFVATVNGTMGLQCSAQGLKASWTSGIAYVSGRRYQIAAGEMSLNPTQGQYLYVDTDGVVKKTTSQTTAQKGLVFFYVATDTSGVISTTDHRVNVSLEEILKKLKDIDIEDAVTGGASGLMTGADAKFVRVDGETKTGAQEKADAVKDYVESRLDTSEYSEVTLQPGLQVIQGKRNAPFTLTGLTGRTLVNLLGRAGGCETISALNTPYQASVAADTVNKTQGSQSIKVTTTALQSGAVSTFPVALKAGYYIVAADVKPISGASMGVYLNGLSSAKGTPNSEDITKFNLVWKAYNVQNATNAYSVGEVIGPVGSAGNIDALRLYEISETEYVALDSMTPEQIAAKYPYVDSVQPVRNPYAIRYGKNLLPPFYEWTKTDHVSTVQEQYVLNGTIVAGAGTDSYAVYYLNVIPNQDYTLINPVESTGFMRISTYNSAGIRIQGIFVKPGESITIKMDVAAVRMGVNVSGVTAYTDDFDTSTWTWETGTSRTFKNPIMIIGSTPKSFKPREDAMLALQTDLFADPLTGANADEVFEKDGCYFKLKKWQRTALDGALGYRTVQNKTDYKIIGCKFPEAAAAFNRLFVSKYNGNLLTKTATMVGPDNAYFLTSDLSDFNLSIANSDSGWGDSYTPTADEIKAYFMGWKMFLNNQPDISKSYNGEAAGKAWCPIDSISNPNTAAYFVNSTVPTEPISNYSYSRFSTWTPYQLVYQLATATVEPITSEGQLTLIEGNNQVEVGTGIVLREAVKPVRMVVGSIEYYHFNNIDPAVKNPFKYRVEKILNIYANGKRVNGVVLKNEDAAYGKQDAHIEGKDFIKDAAYTATYFMLDTSPIVPLVGSVAENEKALLTDMNDILRHNAAAVSVVEATVNEAVHKQNKRNVWGPIG